MPPKNVVSLDQVGRDLAKISGMSEMVETELAALRAAEFVAQTRKAAHLSQAMLAKKLRISQARVSQMEKGEGRYGLSIELLDRVARACGGVLNLSFEKWK